MQVFVTGASGLVGSAVCRALKAKGHAIVGLTSKSEHQSVLNGQGVEPVLGDIRDASAWQAQASQAEAIVHCSQLGGGRLTKKAAAENAAADTEAVKHLVAAAGPNCKAFVYTSGCWVYGDSPSANKDESAALNPYRLVEFKVPNEKLALESCQAKGVAGMAFRLGVVYARRGPFEDLVLKPLKNGKKASYPGGGDQYVSYIHEDDVGSAYVAAIENPKAGEIFNVCDDEPIPVKVMAGEVAKAMGVNKAGGIPGFILKLVVGGLLGECLLNSTRMTNQKFKSAVGWQPQYPTYREGAPAIAKAYAG